MELDESGENQIIIQYRPNDDKESENILKLFDAFEFDNNLNYDGYDTESGTVNLFFYGDDFQKSQKQIIDLVESGQLPPGAVVAVRTSDLYRPIFPKSVSTFEIF